jgi:hypothetical protein
MAAGNYPQKNEAESGCKFIANERGVDPHGADNLTKDPSDY